MANIVLSGIKTRLVQRNYLDSTYTDSIFLDDCHYIAQDIWSDIIYARKWNKNWDIWLADTVALQNEYTRPTVTSTNVGADFIDSVSIVYDSETYANTWDKTYTPCRQATSEEIKDWVRLLEEQSKADPIYFYSDDSIFIAPEIRTWESWTGRLRITWVRSIASGSWTTATTETSIKLPVFLFDSLFYGLMWKSAEHMGREDNVVISKYNFYINHKNQQVRKMNNETSETLDIPDIRDPFLDD